MISLLEFIKDGRLTACVSCWRLVRAGELCHGEVAFVWRESSSGRVRFPNRATRRYQPRLATLESDRVRSYGLLYDGELFAFVPSRKYRELTFQLEGDESMNVQSYRIAGKANRFETWENDSCVQVACFDLKRGARCAIAGQASRGPDDETSFRTSARSEFQDPVVLAL